MGYRQLENERPTPKQQCAYAPLPCHANRRTRVNRPGAPTVYLLQLHNAMQIVLNNRILTCAQDVSRFPNNGAYTGEVSAEMLADIGTDIVLIGHSERSLYFGEKNEIQRRKMENVLNVGLIPLLCVGESLEEREAGKEHEVITHQLSILQGLNTKKHRRCLRAGLGDRYRQSRHCRTNRRHARIYLQRNLVFVRKRC